MRALLVDIGNTSLKVGIASPEAVLTTYTLPTNPGLSGDGLGLQLLELARHAGVESVSQAMISSVVPAMNPLLRHACERFLNTTPLFAHQDVEVPLRNEYERPLEVGADRLVAAYAARQLLPEPRSLISVDFGTATTFDCVTDEAYRGGLICPGVMSSLGALASRTAQLPRIALSTEVHSPELCRSTVTSLNHGFLFGFAAMSEGLCARLKELLEGPVSVLATGGFAPAVAAVASCFDRVVPDLILEGLRRLWLKALDTDRGQA